MYLIKFTLYLPEIRYEACRQQMILMAVDFAESTCQAHCIIDTQPCTYALLLIWLRDMDKTLDTCLDAEKGALCLKDNQIACWRSKYPLWLYGARFYHFNNYKECFYCFLEAFSILVLRNKLNNKHQSTSRCCGWLQTDEILQLSAYNMQENSQASAKTKPKNCIHAQTDRRHILWERRMVQQGQHQRCLLDRLICQGKIILAICIP